MDIYELLAIVIPVLGTIAAAIIAYFVESGLKRKFILVERLWDEKYRRLRELSASLETLKDLVDDVWYLDYGVDLFDGSVEYNTRRVVRKIDAEYGFPEEQSPLMNNIEFSSMNKEDKKIEIARIQNKCRTRIDQKFVESIKKARTLTRELSLLIGDKRIVDLSNDTISRIVMPSGR